VLAWTLLCAAAARPQQLGDAAAPPQSARDLMLAVDLSGSMSEPDMELGGGVVDRLTAAKAVLADFLDRRAGDRVGLLVFGQRAYALAPLTLDLDSVREQLRDSVVGLAGRETAIGDAIALAVKRLRMPQGGQRAPGTKVVILLTDGVNTAGAIDPLKAAELAKAEGVRVHTIAFGGGGEAVSVFGLQLPVPGSGGDDIDEDTLRRIADETGGRFFRARDTEQLAGIYAELDRIEPVKRQGQKVRPRIERYPWPLAASLLVALLAFAWPGRRA
jgi:Ca-activated chloride channel family protein